MIDNFKLKITNYRLLAISFLLIFSSIFSSRSYSQPVTIGVALPLYEESGDDGKKQLGTEILNGINFAAAQFNKTSHTKVRLLIRDTKRSANNTVSIFKEFGENDSVQCVLGPIYSAELGEVAELGYEYDMPIVSPTATGDDLAETHDYVFQLNPSYDIRGKLMADYLIKKLKMKNFAVVAEESYGVNFSEHFESEITKLGGKILLTKTYGKDAKNINDVVQALIKVIKEKDLFINLNDLNLRQRQKVENTGVRSSLIDSLINMNIDVSIYYIFGRNAKKIIDTMNIKPHTLTSENAKFLQGCLDAIYIPISNPAEINMIVPELFSYNLSFFIAGTGDWNSEENLKNIGVYIKNLIFESEYFIDDNGSAVTELKSELKKTKFKLNKSFLFGYDAMNLLLGIIEKGNTSRRDIYNALKKVYALDMIKSKVSLDYNRVNSELNILTYDDGLQKIDAYKISK